MSARVVGAARLVYVGYEVCPVRFPGEVVGVGDGWTYAVILEATDPSDGWTCTPEALERLGEAACNRVGAEALVQEWLDTDVGVQTVDHG